MRVRFGSFSRWLSVLTVTAMVCLPAQGFAASPDSILSGDIREADGTSGLDTNTGAGIKTGHIQNGAITTDKIQDLHVTTGKIADGAVSDAKLGDNAVITAKILDLSVTSPKLADAAVTESKLANGSITGAKIGLGAVGSGNVATGAVTTDKLADGAVTDSKITGPISGYKLGAHAHDGGDIVDGTITSSKVADGAITDAKITGPIAASKISGLPGKYANVVVVAKSGGDFTDPVDALNTITNASETNPYLLKIMPGIYNIGSNTLKIKEYVHVEGSGSGITRIVSSASGFFNDCIGHEVVEGASNSEVSDITIENNADNNLGMAFCGNNISNFKVSNVIVKTLWGGHAFYLVGSNVDINNLNYVSIIGSSQPVTVITNNTNLNIKNSSIDVGGQAMAVYGGTTNVYSSKIVSDNLTIYSTDNNLTSIANSIIELRTKVSNYSASLQTSNTGSIEIHDTKISSVNYGIWNKSNVKVYNSIVSATLNSIYNDTWTYPLAQNPRTYVVNSQLIGSASSLTTCAGVTDVNFNFYSSTCP